MSLMSFSSLDGCKAWMMLSNPADKVCNFIQVHIEETKGTLQLASRAKRIINCAQVNEVLIFMWKNPFYHLK